MFSLPFSACSCDTCSPPPPGPEEPEWLPELKQKIHIQSAGFAKSFRRFDLDKSGFLNAEELRTGFQMLGIDLSDARVAELFAFIDRDRR